jgi:hypothetical protein
MPLMTIRQCRRCADPSHRMQGLTIVSKQRAEFGVADADCTLEDGVKDRPQLAGRARNDAENVGGRRLPLQCLGKVLARLGQLLPAGFELLFRIGARLPLATDARLRLRSCRTKRATTSSAFRALARQGHPRNTSIGPGSPGHRHLKHNTAGPAVCVPLLGATHGNSGLGRQCAALASTSPAGDVRRERDLGTRAPVPRGHARRVWCEGLCPLTAAWLPRRVC